MSEIHVWRLDEGGEVFWYAGRSEEEVRAHHAAQVDDEEIDIDGCALVEDDYRMSIGGDVCEDEVPEGGEWVPGSEAHSPYIAATIAQIIADLGDIPEGDVRMIATSIY